MKKIILVLFIYTFSALYVKAQTNLVKNPSFEQYYTCPHDQFEVSFCKYWSAVVDTSYAEDSSFLHGVMGTIRTYDAGCMPYYCNTCDDIIADPSGEATVPLNAFFYHYPRTGNGMMFTNNLEEVWGNDNRFYLQGRLYHPLLAGQSYCVTFYVVNTHYTGHATNNMGVYFDNGMIDTTTECGKVHTEYSPQILDTAVISDTLNWTKIQGSFIATGTETFLTIGNFFDSIHTRKLYLGHGAPLHSYYLVDDVSVIATGTTAYAGRDTTIHAGDSTYIGIDRNGEGMPCLWYTLVEPTPIDSGGRIRVHPACTTTYIVAMDLCGTITYDTVVVTVADVGMNKLNEQFLHIYPNPAKDNFTIEGAWGCEVRIYNVVGQLVAVSPCCHGEPTCRGSAGLTMTTGLNMTSNKEMIDISGLSKGVYIVEVLEPETGMKISRRVVKE